MQTYHAKAMSAITLVALIGIVLGVIAILPLSKILGGVIKAMTPPPEDVSIASFSKVLSAAQAITKAENAAIKSCFIPTVQPHIDDVIVGFNKKNVYALHDPKLFDEIQEFCGIIRDNVDKPAACGEQACVCLCKRGWRDISGDMCDGKYCKPLPSIDRLTTTFNDVKEDLVLYAGEYYGGRAYMCGQPGAKTVIVEKVSDNELHIFKVDQERATKYVDADDSVDCEELYKKTPEKAQNVA